MLLGTSREDDDLSLSQHSSGTVIDNLSHPPLRFHLSRKQPMLDGRGIVMCVTLDDRVVLYGLDLSTWGAWAGERDLPAGSADNVPVFVGRRVVRFHWRSAGHFQIRRTVPMKIDLVAQRNYLFTYDGKQYGPLLNVEKAIVVYTRGSRFLEGTPLPPSRFDHQATYLDFWVAACRSSRSSERDC